MLAADKPFEVASRMAASWANLVASFVERATAASSLVDRAAASSFLDRATAASSSAKVAVAGTYSVLVIQSQ